MLHLMGRKHISEEILNQIFFVLISIVIIIIHISYQTLFRHKTNVHKATLNHYEIKILTFFR
jgi:hypothetical protein